MNFGNISSFSVECLLIRMKEEYFEILMLSKEHHFEALGLQNWLKNSKSVTGIYEVYKYFVKKTVS